MNSRAKGARGEREFAELLRSHGIEARRGQQFSGSPDSPDVVTELPYHFEVKRVERLQIYDAIEQAVRDCQNKKIPIVVHKKNRQEWLVIMRFNDWIKKEITNEIN